MILRAGLTFGTNGRFGSPEKKFGINFSKVNINFCLSFHCDANNSYLFVDGKEIFEFKTDNKNVNFPLNFVSEVYLMDLVLLSVENGNVYDFSVSCNSVKKSDVLNIHKYLMIKNNIR